MNDFSKALGARIKYRREALGMSQRELAENMRVQPPSIAMYESGRRTPSLDLFFKLAKELGTTTDFLLGATDQQNMLVDDEIAEAFRQFALLAPRDRKVVMELMKILGKVDTMGKGEGETA
jgi:transcriptional regulator with XRE-family HTH domain